MVKLTRLREYRERKALTQQELATLAGVSRPTVARIEAGTDEPFPATTRKLAKALGVRPDDLMDSAEVAPSRLPYLTRIEFLDEALALDASVKNERLVVFKGKPEEKRYPDFDTMRNRVRGLLHACGINEQDYDKAIDVAISDRVTLHGREPLED